MDIKTDCRAGRLLTWVLLALALADFGKAQEPSTITVCEVFKDLEGWSGKVIAVHGELIFGGYPHGTYAVQERGCPVSPETNGKKWATSIWLVKPPASAEASLADPKALKVLGDFAGAIIGTYWGPTAPPFKITATFIGTLRTRELDYLDEQGFGSGFGSSGAWPAQLEAIAARDIVVTQVVTPTGPNTPEPK